MIEPKTVSNPVEHSHHNGFLLIDKPKGISSFQSLRPIKRSFRGKKVGFAGTLDPAATGLLVVAIGQATRLLTFVESKYKEYVFDLVLGIETDSYDLEGEIIKTHPTDTITFSHLENTLERYRGKIEQIPPKYSAIKIKGKRACDRMRAGEDVTLKSKKVIIHELEILNWKPPRATIRLVCSKGTYIRALARDMGED